MGEGELLHTVAKYTGLWDQEVCRGLEPGRAMLQLGWMLGSKIQFIIQGFVKASIETPAIHLYGQMDTGWEMYPDVQHLTQDSP